MSGESGASGSGTTTTMTRTKITLPAILNPISRRKDKSVKLSLDTRELGQEDILTLLALEGAEMWVCLSPNEAELEVPEEKAEVNSKSPSSRLRNTLFVLWKQETDAGRVIGTFETFRGDWMEKIIQSIKDKLN